ncbi:hypothetical protein [Gemmatimonas sp.]|uniref:hypothetical protein n=1 Tax=Gemmatimonas sp. TaxID=1962908 RepID=UPI0025B839E9|nr:hypothetical protein [Gemmatimonas sp.]MCA2991619.1 hypothetical protein [Gemmatimonas sp.]
MKFQDCRNCGTKTGFKRSFGFGTFIGLLLTGGFLLLALPFYPIRCIKCGGSPSEMRTDAERKAVLIRAGALIGGSLLFVIALSFMSR